VPGLPYDVLLPLTDGELPAGVSLHPFHRDIMLYRIPVKGLEAINAGLLLRLSKGAVLMLKWY